MKTEPIAGQVFSLDTESASMVFKFLPDYGVWTIPYFGPRITDPQDAAVLSSFSGNYGTSNGKTIRESYPAFGSDIDPHLLNTHGGLTAVHHDGCAGTSWRAESAVRTEAEDGVTHVEITLRDAEYDFRAVQHFRIIKGIDVFETWVELKNSEPGSVRLSVMDSAAFEFLGLPRDLSVLTLYGQWANEAQLSVSQLHRGQTIAIGARSGVRDAWDSNPSFMLFESSATEESGLVYGCALAWSGAWHASLSRTSNGELRMNAGADNPSGPYIMRPGTTLMLPKFIMSCSVGGFGKISRAFHKWAREKCLPHGGGVRDVLLNSWEGAYFSFNEKTLTDMMDGVRELGGELFVIDDGWFGLGEYARDDDRRGLGDWFWNTKKLPRGLKYLTDEAAKRGLKLGLWIEPEMANTRSEIAVSHPDWIMREKGRPLRTGRGESQVVLDMTNPEVRDEIFRRISDIIESAPALAYIKWDANADFMNPGSAYLEDDCQTNIWFDYASGVRELAQRLASKFPGIIFQACSSGGAHADFASLSTADEFWGSDNTDARQRIFIQWGEQMFYPACAMACHVTAVPSHQTGRVTPLKFRFDVAMSGRLGFELHPANMTPEEIRFAKIAVADYKSIRSTVQLGNLYRLVSPYGNDHAALMYSDDSMENAVVFVWGLNRRICGDYPPPIKLAGVDPAKRYSIREINKNGEKSHSDLDGAVVGGDALMNMGMGVALSAEYDSAVFVLKAV